jgi:outer membrane protein
LIIVSTRAKHVVTRAAVMTLIVTAWLSPAFAKPKPNHREYTSTISRLSTNRPLPPFVVAIEPRPTETLADALAAAYRSNPALQVRRYELRATDEDYAQALAELRPTVELQVTSGYTKTVPGRTSQLLRPLADRLRSPIITGNTLSTQVIVDQPLSTGGKASADRAVASAAILAARASLQGTEGDLFLQVVASYAAIRRDNGAIGIRDANLRQLEATLDEVKARRQAGELTRTDIAQAETQLDLARTQVNIAEQQLEQDRATFASLVGRDPGILAPEPALPQFPYSVDAAFEIADRLNPELEQAIQAERSSRARISAAAAEGRPRLSLRGTGSLNGQAAPFYLFNEDQGVSGQAVLTIPLSQGGRVGSLKAQASDRNAADRLRIEGARRQMVQSIVDAWNAVSTAQRNVRIQTGQRASARILDEGTFEEYRAGLRSTFDVLFAHGTLRDAEIALITSRHDLYVAQATLLRHIGLLEARSILTGTALYDPSVQLRHSSRRSALPWDAVVREIDRNDQPHAQQRGLEQPQLPTGAPALVAEPPLPDVTLAKVSPNVPVPGTTGAPSPRPRKRF